MNEKRLLSKQIERHMNEYKACGTITANARYVPKNEREAKKLAFELASNFVAITRRKKNGNQ